MKFDYEKLGFKAGLEVHQQLDTRKLFSRTKSELSEAQDFFVERKLRPVASELGEYDKTSLEAFKRSETFVYTGNKKNISLIELDEEPPQPLDKDALRTVLEISLLCNSKPVSKSIVMRKTVIDGSNTSAFQRTMMISLGGELKISGGKKIGVQTIILEEDAARPLKKEDRKIFYNLDRLGIPLIELATDPDIRTPREAVECAEKIGEIMRLTCKTKRGKGTIRQDVNVSIKEGARCEIKGCQELELIETVVEKEVERQLDLLKLKTDLNKKFGTKTKNSEKLSKELFGLEKDVSEVFKSTECKFIKGKKVFGLCIKGFKGFLGQKIGSKRFGSEVSQYCKASGVTGLLHRDELPNYGVNEKEVQGVMKALGCKNEDSFILIVAEKERALNAFETAKKRVLIAFEKVPEETRGALEDGSSEYQRLLSTEARMYPETDIPGEEISEKMVSEIKKGLPISVEERKKLYTKLGLSTNHIEEMKLSNYARFFERIVENGANPKASATLLLQTLTELKRKGINVEEIDLQKIEELLLSEAKRKISKANLEDAIIELSKGKSVSEIIEETKKESVSEKELEKIVQKIVAKNSELVKTKGLGAIGGLMGDLMREVQGIDGKRASELLKKEIAQVKK